MRYILMQPANNRKSVEATNILINSSKCLFDLTPKGARLLPIKFGSRACTSMEMKLHSFVGEVAAGRWAIRTYKRYLWGTHFWWLCDCNSVKAILEYQGPIAVVLCWAQELLSYNFTVFNCTSKMMCYVDCTTRFFGKLIAQHLCISEILHEHDYDQRPSAYVGANFTSHIGKRNKTIHVQTNPSPPLTQSFFHNCSYSFATNTPTTSASLYLSSFPPNLTPTLFSEASVNHSSTDLTPKVIQDTASYSGVWCNFNDVIASTNT